ncbi:TPA: hypothetical protein HH785_004814 [Escherichia coli]|nr:hypothetical protein [Escherichia coli]
MSGRSRGRGVTQYVDENAADGVAHVVFPDRSAPVRFRKILLREFSDLREKREKVYVISVLYV